MENTKDKQYDEIIDEEGYNASKTNSIKDITMKRFSEALEAKSKEMNSGGERVIIHEGRVFKVFAPNTCEIYYNSVQALEIALYPKIREHKDKKEIKNKYDEYKQAKQDFEKWIKDKRELIEEYSQNKKLAQTATIEQQKSIYQRDMKRVELANQLFEILSLLMNICNYFDESSAGYGG